MELKKPSFLENITLEKTLIYILIFAVLVIFIFVFYLLFLNFTKNIQITSPVGGEEWEIGQTYKISWKSRGVDRVGIVLFKREKPFWIAKNVVAEVEQYEWKIFPGQEYGDDYWIAVFEYPWKKGGTIDYSDNSFAVVYSELANCDALSLQNQWPFIPSDMPQFRRVFITSNSFTGNLGQLQGADEKCQAEAEEKGLGGNWLAFLGGDQDSDLAIERLRRTPQGLSGIFVQANPASTLIRGATCHRLLGRDFNDFLAKLSSPVYLNEQRMDKELFDGLANVWLGRLDEKSRKNCAGISAKIADKLGLLKEQYSLTTTCQNWTTDEEFVAGYPVALGSSKPPFPTCYTPQGIGTDAVGLGGLSGDLAGSGKNAVFTPYSQKECRIPQKLLCIEK